VKFDDYRNWLLVQAWVRDRRAGLSHVFVERSLRRRILDYGRSHAKFRSYVRQAAMLLKQPEDAAPHDDHFHVRIACPRRQRPPGVSPGNHFRVPLASQVPATKWGSPSMPGCVPPHPQRVSAPAPAAAAPSAA
jgi:penicillin-insensitive murein endopeptidase